MKTSKFSEAQITFVLKQAEGYASVAEVCRKAGIGVATFYNWCKKYAGLMPSEAKRLRQLEDEVREGWKVNQKRIRIFYNELGLQLRNKTPKRWVKTNLRQDRSAPPHANQVWAMNFVHDQLATGNWQKPSYSDHHRGVLTVLTCS